METEHIRSQLAGKVQVTVTAEGMLELCDYIDQLRATVSRLEGENEQLRAINTELERELSGLKSSVMSVIRNADSIESSLRTRLTVLERVREAAEEVEHAYFQMRDCQEVVPCGRCREVLHNAVDNQSQSLAAAKMEGNNGN